MERCSCAALLQAAKEFHKAVRFYQENVAAGLERLAHERSVVVHGCHDQNGLWKFGAEAANQGYTVRVWQFHIDQSQSQVWYSARHLERVGSSARSTNFERSHLEDRKSVV